MTVDPHHEADKEKPRLEGGASPCRGRRWAQRSRGFLGVALARHARNVAMFGSSPDSGGRPAASRAARRTSRIERSSGRGRAGKAMISALMIQPAAKGEAPLVAPRH